jgi:voltage-gated potassium channel
MNDWISALYFVVISMLTVGYGDITPFTNIGKVFTGALLILGAIWSALFIIFSLGVLEFRDEEFRSYACKG